MVAGDAFVDTKSSPACLRVNPSSGGYDGQFYYRLAIEPFSTAPVLAGVRFDYAVYRSQRIFYPLVAHVLGLGDECAVLWSLPAVNVLALMFLVWAGLHYGALPHVPAYAAILVLWPGFLFSLARDLTEPLASGLLLTGLAVAARGSWRWATLCLSLAALTRETALVAAAIVVLFGLVKSIAERRANILLVVGTVPIAVCVGWKRWLFWWWQLPVNWGTGTIGSIPFTGFFGLLRDSYGAGTHAGRLHVIELTAIFAFSCAVILALRHSTAPRLVKACALAYFAFVFSLSRDVWVEDWAFLRATAEYGVLGGAVLAGSRPRFVRIGAMLFVAALAGLGYEMFAFR